MEEHHLRDMEPDQAPWRAPGGWLRNVIPYAALVALGVMAVVFLPPVESDPRASLAPAGSASGAPPASASPTRDVEIGATLVATIPIEPTEDIGLGAFDALWLVDERAGVVKRIDPRAAAVTDTHAIRPPRSKGGMRLAASEDLLWVGRGGTPAIVGLDPATGRVVVAAEVALDPYALAAGFGEVWVTDRRRGLVVGLDGANGVEIHRVRVAGATGIVVGETSVWVTSVATDGLVEIDRGSGQVLRTVLTGPTPTHAYLDPGGLTIYVLGRNRMPITAVDVSGSVRQGTVELSGMTFVDGAPWSLLPASPVVGRLDPDSLLFTGAVQLPDGPGEGIAFAGGLVWVADATHLHGIRPAR